MGTLEVKRSGPETCTIRCAHCGKGKALHRDAFRQLPRPLKVKCGCGEVSQWAIEKRRSTRCPVQLVGTLSTVDRQESLGSLRVTELSLQGAAFILSAPGIEVGQRYRLSFELDDESRAVIEKDLVVRHVQTAGGRVGAEFLDPEDYDFALDLYLLNLAIPGYGEDIPANGEGES